MSIPKEIIDMIAREINPSVSRTIY